MNDSNDTPHTLSRRDFILTSASGITGTIMAGSLSASAQDADAPSPPAVTRWGFVGTGSIANKMAEYIKGSKTAELAASSSRTLDKAVAFAKKHGAEHSFDSWQKMFETDLIDAVYVATPTSVKEEISIAAANAGKHVLCEKPIASSESLQRIIKACHDNNVAFMDGTRLSHHPRTSEIKSKLDKMVGKVRTIDSVFQFKTRDQSNIRLNPTLEPMGALGDAGWYNMRAIVEYINPDTEIQGVSAFIRRNPKSNAVIGATGIVSFKDGSSSTWTCALDAAYNRRIARVDGNIGGIDIPNYITEARDYSGAYHYSSKEKKFRSKSGDIKVTSPVSEAVILFDDFSAQIHDAKLRTIWETKCIRTQHLLDLAWESAIANEKANQ